MHALIGHRYCVFGGCDMAAGQISVTKIPNFPRVSVCQCFCMYALKHCNQFVIDVIC